LDEEEKSKHDGLVQQKQNGFGPTFFFWAQFADEKRVHLGFGLPRSQPASLEAKPSERH